MTEGSRTTDPTAEANGTTDDSVVAAGAQTVEEVEAIYRNRMSGKDRAHNAEIAALRAEFDRQLNAATAPAPVGEAPQADPRVRELEARLAEEQALRLKAQYPLTADALGDSITNLPPEKIAAVEARFAEQDGIRPINDSNMAPRRGTAVQGPDQKPLNEKSKDELLADLMRLAPAFQEARREGSV